MRDRDEEDQVERLTTFRPDLETLFDACQWPVGSHSPSPHSPGTRGEEERTGVDRETSSATRHQGTLAQGSLRLVARRLGSGDLFLSGTVEFEQIPGSTDSVCMLMSVP